MATKAKPAPKQEDVDDLLGDLPAAPAKAAAKKKATKTEETEEVDSAEALTAALAGEPTAKEKKEKQAKVPKAPRDLKGVPVTFTTKGTGEQITGLGVLYYVTRYKGKLYYKEASQVHVLTAEEIAALAEEPEVVPSNPK